MSPDIKQVMIHGENKQFNIALIVPNRENISKDLLDDKEKMKQTVVPNRNMIMISVAASLAIKNKCEYLWYAAHAGDHEIYPDCRPEFISKLGEVLKICDYHEIVFEAPFKGMTKGEIIKEGLNMDLDYSKAWTCYEGKENPCGKCSACLERQNAFKINNIEDPL